jgi:stearoyl-CoA desaturase (delta-9 desaturase)
MLLTTENTRFINDHPGGQAMLSSQVGKDATAAFNGGIYNHTNSGHNLLSSMRVAALRGGMEVEAWKKDHNMEPPCSTTI